MWLSGMHAEEENTVLEQVDAQATAKRN